MNKPLQKKKELNKSKNRTKKKFKTNKKEHHPEQCLSCI